MNEEQFYILRGDIGYWGGLILGIVIVMFGAMSNIAVIGFNDGRMPVEMSYYYSSDEHFSYNESSEISLRFLSDKYYFANRIFSLGDYLMFMGAIMIILTIINNRFFYKKWIKRKIEKGKVDIIFKSRH